MKFLRKLVVREGIYGTISVPKPVLDSWSSVEEMELDFDERSNILLVTPKQKGLEQDRKIISEEL